MRLIVWLVIVAACEKSGPVETAGGSSSSPHEPTTQPVGPSPAKVATLPNDAGIPADAARGAVVDGAVAVARRPAVPLSEADARALAGLLVAGDDKKPDYSHRSPGVDLDRQIAEVRDGGRARAIGGGGGIGGSRAIGDARVAVGAGTAPAITSGPTVRVALQSKQALDDTTLTADAVAAKLVSAYLAGIKRCYKTTLDKDPNVRGTATLSFTVRADGRTVALRSKSFASAIDDCLTGMMSGWRFPIPKDSNGDATEARFEIALAMTPA